MNLREKVRIYETVLHQLHMRAAVAMNPARFSELMEAVSNWSYAHRQGNGELSDQQQRRLIRDALKRLAAKVGQ